MRIFYDEGADSPEIREYFEQLALYGE